ncbi:hypothetical protein C8R43DRAFT_1234578 [Mycena crocata]|nr:hypothetical protein C8R43DRAFT_1234578 [Mycena crocata]
MHFARSFLAFAVLAGTAVQAAPSLTTSLTKRNYCGFEPSCHCKRNKKEGCELQLDECSQQYYWPPQCTGCEPCLPLCVDFFQCVGPSKSAA